MKIQLSVLLPPALMVIAMHQPAHAAGIAVPNAGFESVEEGAVSGWSGENSDGSRGSWSRAAGSGRGTGAALQVKKDNAEGTLVLRSGRLDAQPKQTYRLTAWVKLNGFSTSNIYCTARQYPAAATARPITANGSIQPLFSTGGEWERIQYIFTTPDGVQQMQIGLVISDGTADLLLDDVELVSVSTEEYQPRYEPPTPEDLQPRDQVEAILQRRPRATAEVRRVGERPRLFVDGRETVPLFYKAPSSWKLEKSQVGDFQRAGVNVYVISYILGRGVYKLSSFGSWLGKDKTDFSDLDALMWRVLQADPNGYIIFDISTDPYAEWGAEHPDDVVTNEKGQKVIVDLHYLRFGGQPNPTTGRYVERYGYSSVSQQLRRDTVKVLEQFDEHVRQSLPGKAVIGYYVNGGDDGQMFAWEDRGDELTDYSPAARASFRLWLKARYGTDESLRAAWHQKEVTLETAEVPTAARRLASKFLLDPAREQDILDYKRFHSEGIVDTRNLYAATLRKSHQTPIVIGAYYAGPTIGIPSHRGTEYLLKGGQFNLLTSVLAYGAPRVPGGVGKAHQAWESLLLHDTIGVAEEDFRTWKSTPGAMERDTQLLARADSAEKIQAMIRRDTGRMLANGQGVWFYDMDGGWFNDPSIMSAVRESTNAFRSDLARQELPRADVAVFVDEAGLNLINNQNIRPYRQLLTQQILQLKASGVSFHTYLQSDIDNPRLPTYKLYVFLNAYQLKPQEWAALQGLKRDGKTLCFVHAPGVASPETMGAANAAEALTHMTEIEIRPGQEQSLALQSAAAPGFESSGAISYGVLRAPAYIVADDKSRILATYKADSSPAVAIKDFGNWKSVFFGGIGMTSSFVHDLARTAGAWTAAEPGTAVYGNQNFLIVHAMYPGTRTVQLLSPARVTDAADSSLVSARTQSLTLPMRRGETRWFQLDPVQ
jgi:hypothetical protein